MSRYDSLGDRMKSYENVTKTFLMPKTPIVIRLDGKAFHTYTQNCEKPFDDHLHMVREQVLKYLCENIQGCIIGYAQSDEISLVLKDWQSYNTQGWFDNSLRKIISVSASMCTMKWNELAIYYGLNNTAIFDSRAFSVPKEEVINYLIWRQQDWERNSVQMLAQSFYSQKQIHGISCPELITKIETDKNVVWGNLEDWKKRGEIIINNQSMSFIFKEQRYLIDQVVYHEENNI